MLDETQQSPADWFGSPIAQHIWDTKYRYRDGETVHDITVEDTWRRVARALAGVEPRDGALWEAEFYRCLEGFQFLPGGRTLAGAGTERKVTLCNCFVMGPIEDSMEGIFDALKEGMVTMQQGGGVGYDFSTLRPTGSPAHAGGGTASGPVSFMRIWDQACDTLLSTTGARRGAMMATLRCDHPDIEAFVDAKRTRGSLTNFNLSVLASDAFMAAVEAHEEWPLVFPPPDARGESNAQVVRTVPARALWEKIMLSAYETAEPGVLFIDRINQWNNLWYRETIRATNPCGEVPLPPYGACALGSVNLTRFVREPFTSAAHIDRTALAQVVSLAVRMLDNVIDASRYPLSAQHREAQHTRRIGLGVTGLADMLLMLGLEYGSEAARRTAAGVMAALRETAYHTSVRLAREKGHCPAFDAERYMEGRFVRSLPVHLQEEIAASGIRNSHLVAIAPTGTISLLAGNVSGGIEPVFARRCERRVRDRDGGYIAHEVDDYACSLWLDMTGGDDAPPALAEASALSPAAHLEMQAALQPYVDNAISKTVNVPVELGFGSFAGLYERAFELGLKGCTAFRPNDISGAILSVEADVGGCCDLEREAD